MHIKQYRTPNLCCFDGYNLYGYHTITQEQSTLKIRSYVCLVLPAFILHLCNYELSWQAVHTGGRFAGVNSLSRIAIVFMRETCFLLGWAKVRGNRNTRIICRHWYEYICTRFDGNTGFLNPYCGTVNCGNLLSHGVRKSYYFFFPPRFK